MKFDASTIRNLIIDDCANERFEWIEESSWEDDGKYSYKDMIFKFDNKFYRVGFSRSGSYYSDYYYSYKDWGKEIECDEVEKQLVTIEKWIKV
jgi:hypothetical protein